MSVGRLSAHFSGNTALTSRVGAVRSSGRTCRYPHPYLLSTIVSNKDMSAQAAHGSQTANAALVSSVPGDFGELWNVALRRYKKETGKDLPDLAMAKELPPSGNVDDIMDYIETQGERFGAFRERGKKVLIVLKPIVNFVHLFIDAGAEAAAASVRTTRMVHT